MEILFGQHFDQGYYLDYSLPENQNIFNKMIVGPLGLLNLLERDLGLSGIFPSLLERKVKYREILMQYMQLSPNNLFAKSFLTDPEGVTSELLLYRDQLILAGWNSKTVGISVKIDLLASIEGSATIPIGSEDRWIKVLQLIQQNENFTLGLIKISLNEPVEEMHPFFGSLISQLNNRGVEVITLAAKYTIDYESNLGMIKKNILEKVAVGDINLTDNSSLQILRFKSDADAAEFLASQRENLRDTVIHNRDNRLFDEMLNSFGHPVSGSEQLNSNPSLIQLFKLIIVLLVKPINIHNLMSFLQVEVNPIPVALRYKLMKVLKNTGGMNNPEWNQTIQEFEFKNAETKDKAANFLHVRNFPENKIDPTIASLLYHSLESWAQERMILGDNSPSISLQLAYLIELCRAIREILNHYQNETLSAQELLLIISGIYEPHTFGNYVPQIGSCPVLASPGQLINHPKTIVWLDFYNEAMKPAFYAFLNSDECRNLAQKDIHIWSIPEQVSAQMAMLLRGLLIPDEKCVLIVVEKAGDKVVTDHPVHSYLKAILPDLENITTDVTTTDSEILEEIEWPQPEIVLLDTTTLPEKKEVHEIALGAYIPNRQTESSSSMELLIQNPFDWVLQYGMQIQPGNSYQLDDLFTTQGNVAHKFIEVLFTEANNDLQQARTLLNEYNRLLQSVIEGFGMILLLDENRFEYEVFKSKLLNSVSILIQILEENQLAVSGMEQSETTQIHTLNDQEVLGKIDLVLTTRNGHKAIFDLKWSRRPKKFYTLIRNNKHIQLAIYKDLLEAANHLEVDFVAYYSMSEAQLISTANLTGASVIHVENTDTSAEILARVQNSLTFRRNQLANGIIEDAGGSNLERLDYYQNQDLSNLVPLETEYKKPLIKKINVYSQFKTFKGEIK